MAKKEVFHYRLAVRGVFGRNRKEKFELFELVKNVPRDKPKTLADLMPLVKETIARERIRSGAQIVVREEPVEVDDNGWESFMLMSERVLHKEVLP